MPVTIYTKIHLLKALENAGLPHTYKSLLNYERQGIIPKGGEVRAVNTQRYYTQEDIDGIVRKIRDARENGVS